MCSQLGCKRLNDCSCAHVRRDSLTLMSLTGLDMQSRVDDHVDLTYMGAH
jgi:hypothetical protein